MNQSIYRKLAQLEMKQLVRRQQAERHTRAPSAAEVMNRLLSSCGADAKAGESRAETLAGAAGIATREMKNLLHGIASH